MHKFNVSFTKTQAQLVEVELEDEPRFLGVGKDARQSAWVIGQSGEAEFRMHGKYIVPAFVDPDVVGGRSEADFLTELERCARQTTYEGVKAASPIGHPKLVVIRAGAQRAYAALCSNVDPANGLEEQYTLSIPTMRF